MRIQLSDHFTTGRLLRFTLPSIAMMIFTSIYGVVDGFFVSNFAGKTPFAAVNLIYPFLMIMGALGFMFGTGGSALIALWLGRQNREKANQIFSMLTAISAVLGVLIAAVGIAVLRPVAQMLGAQGEMLESCVRYGRIVLAAIPAFMLQMQFQSFFITAEKPRLGLFVTVLSGVTNMVLDALFVAVLRWGLEGAALATAISQIVGAALPLIYFLRPNSSLLRLGRFAFDGRALLRTCTNGSSELMSNVSMSLVSMLYNTQLMKFAGEDGVAAYGVLMYVSFIFTAAFIGYSIGSAPLIGFNYGAQNRPEMKNLLRKSLTLILIAAATMCLLGEVLATPLSRLFVGYDPSLLALTKRGFSIYSLSFLFSGLSIFGSGFFTALNNGLISAIISFLRTLVFQVAAVLLLPLLMGIDGIWLSIVVAELLSALITIALMVKLRRRYGY